MSVTAPRPRVRGAPGRYRLKVDAYHWMIAAGIFAEDERVELIEGELRVMPPINAEHAGKNKRLNRLFSARLAELAAARASVAVQDPLTLPERSEPEPDLMLLRPRADFYEGANPTPADPGRHLARHRDRGYESRLRPQDEGPALRRPRIWS